MGEWERDMRGLCIFRVVSYWLVEVMKKRSVAFIFKVGN